MRTLRRLAPSRRAPQRRLFKIALLATTLAILSSGSATATTRPNAASPPERTLASLLQSGHLDPGLVSTVQESGHAEAMVALSRSNAAAEAARAGAPGSAAHLSSYRRSLAQTRAGVSLGDVEVLDTYSYVGAMHIAVDSVDELVGLANQPGVTHIGLNRVAQPSMTEALQVISQPQALAEGVSGAGAIVAVLDTGAAHTNPVFGTCPAPGASGCRIKKLVDISGFDDARDLGANGTGGHGTLVAATVLAVAPQVDLHVYDITEAHNRTWPTWQAAAIDAVLADKAAGQNIRALNMSIGRSSSGGCADTIGVGDLVVNGIIPVMPSGNDGLSNAIDFPACLPNAVAVGATHDRTASQVATSACTDYNVTPNTIWCGSNSSAALDIVAPGAEISAAGLTNSGTSFASPQVAAAAAGIWQVSPGRSTLEVINALKVSGPLIPDPTGVAVRRLNVHAALASLDPLAASQFATVYRAGDGTLRQTFYTGVNWVSQGIPVTGPGPAANSQPSATVGSNGWFHVVYRATDGSLRQTFHDGANWVSQGIPVTGPGPAANSQPFALSDGGSFHVVYRATDGTLRQTFYNGTSWSSQGIPVTGAGPAADSNPTVTAHGGWFHVVYRATDGTLRQTFYSGTTWATQTIITTGSGPAANSQPFARSTGGSFHVVYRATDGTLRQTFFNGTSWSSQGIPVTGAGPAADSNPTAASSGGWFQVVYRATGGALRQTFFNGTTWVTQSITTSGSAPAANSQPFASFN